NTGCESVVKSFLRGRCRLCETRSNASGCAVGRPGYCRCGYPYTRTELLMAAEWWRNAVFYEIYVRSFADSNGDGVGDLPGITGRLTYLRELGVDAIWLTPFYPSPGVDHGYDVSDYVDVDPQFGTLTDFDELLASAHELGIRVIVDIVPNHTSNQHPWFTGDRSRYVTAPAAAGLPHNWPSTWRRPARPRGEGRGECYLH